MEWDTRFVVELLGLHLFESTVVAMAILLLEPLFRVKRAAVRFKLIQVALLKFILPIGALVVLYEQGVGDQVSTIGASLTSVVSSTADFVVPQDGVSYWQYGVGIWTLGALILVVRYFRGWTRVEAEKLSTMSEENYARVDSVLRELGSENQLKSICIEESVTTPIALVGIFRPRIVINEAFLIALSDSELRSALRHELEHWKRRDNLWRLLQVFVVSFFWYHPLVWYAHFRSCLESECACDEAAMEGGEGKKSYANCLLKAATFVTSPDRLWAPALTGNPLKRRIKEIVNFENKKDSKMKLLSMWSLIASVMVGTSLIAADYQSVSDDSIEPEKKVYDLKDLDQKPKSLYQVRPEYPAELKEAGIEGWVQIEWIINDLGGVQKPRAIKSSHREFEGPALDAILKSKWQSGRIDGEAVNVRVRQRMDFKL